MGIPFRRTLLVTANAAKSGGLYEGLRMGGGMPPCQSASTLLADARLSPDMLVVIDCATFVTARAHALASVACQSGCGAVVLANARETDFADLVPMSSLKGVLAPPVSSRLIQRAVYALGRNELCFSRQFLSRHLETTRLGRDPLTSAPVLTAREWRVLALIAEGHSNAAIAARLSLSPHTVKTHTQNIFRKIGAANRTQAAQWAHNRWPASVITNPPELVHASVSIVA